jgi:hypothetical protein
MNLTASNRKAIIGTRPGHCQRRKNMAEIKSTIDLIMERTKNLSASPEEREDYQRREREKHIRGLVLRLLDDSLTLDGIKDELAKEKKNGREAEAMAFLKDAMAAHVDPDTDNERLIRIIQELAGTPEDRLRETLRACQVEFFAKKTALMERLKGELESKGIAGSAVLPNPEADPQWKTRREQTRQACVKRVLTAIGG